MLAGRNGVIFGVANKRSIAWACAQAAAANGARLVLTYQGDRLAEGVQALAETLPHGAIALPCDVGSDEGLEQFFGRLREHMPEVDFAVHSIAFAKTEELEGDYVQTSRDGLSLLITTPALLYLLWPREKPPVHRALWLTVLAVSVVSFMYHSDGYVQFGYRYSLDYMVFLVMLLALGGRPQTRTFRALTVFGILVNLFGALTFEGLGSTQFFDGFFPAE